MMTFEKLTEHVAKYFYDAMNEGDFETFTEMKECYWWTTKDIKAEMDAVIKACDADEYDRHGLGNDYKLTFMHDDGTYVQIGDSMMPYRDFSLIVFGYINLWLKCRKAVQ